MAVTHKIAMAQQPLPLGWNYSYLNDGFVGPNGEFISRDMVQMHGSFHKAHNYMYGAQTAQMTQTRSGSGPIEGDMKVNQVTGQLEVYTNGRWLEQSPNAQSINRTLQQTGSFNMSNMTGQEKMRITSGGQLSVGASIQPAAEITVQGKLGTITINLDTGELKMPPNVGRDAAIRDFWLGFQENFQPTNKAKYEQQIKDLQLQVAQAQASAALMKKDDEKEASKKVAEKIAKKYNGEKFIMVKPEDLIRFIQEA